MSEQYDDLSLTEDRFDNVSEWIVMEPGEYEALMSEGVIIKGDIAIMTRRFADEHPHEIAFAKEYERIGTCEDGTPIYAKR